MERSSSYRCVLAYQLNVHFSVCRLMIFFSFSLDERRRKVNQMSKELNDIDSLDKN